jgi:hypothetical protein
MVVVKPDSENERSEAVVWIIRFAVRVWKRAIGGRSGDVHGSSNNPGNAQC